MTPSRAPDGAVLPRGADVVVAGGGLVGATLAWGIARSGLSVALLDEGDEAFRASRGNFGLVWIQGKGRGCAPYARWSMRSGRGWAALAAQLMEDSRVDVELRQPGGFHVCLSEEEFAARRATLGGIRDSLGGDYDFTMLDGDEARRRLPALGPEVVGASHCPHDGHANPLRLLRALHDACRKRGVTYVPGAAVDSVRALPRGFRIATPRGPIDASRVVLAAGLGNRALAAQVGLNVPVVPNRGQVLVAERIAPFLTHPTTQVRQTGEGTVQLGDSMEDAGFDDLTSTDVLAAIARRGVRSFPALARVRLVRAWAALRVMSPDGFPVYAESRTCPGAFAVTCHSGVTLAAVHAQVIAPWLAGGPRPEGIDAFTDQRFGPLAEAPA